MTPGMPPMPPLQLSLANNSRSGDINAPNTVYFGGFGSGSGGGGGLDGAIAQYWPLAAGAAVLFFLLRKKQ